MERGLHAYLADHPALTLLVGTAPVRIHPLSRPMGGAYPCIVYRRLTTARQYHLRAAAGTPTATVQVTCLGGEGTGGYNAAKDLAAAVRPLLDGFKGTWRVSGVPDFVIDGTRIDDERDVWEAPDVAEDDSRGVEFDVIVDFREIVVKHLS